MRVVGDSEKPEVKKHIDDMDNAWDNVTALFAKREENLISAMEKAMDFHNTLQVRQNKQLYLGPLSHFISMSYFCL